MRVIIGVDNRTGPRPALIGPDIVRLRTMLAEGMRPGDVARALGVNVRTVYRYRDCEIVRETVAGWPLTFLVYPGRRPVLIDGTRRR